MEYKVSEDKELLTYLTTNLKIERKKAKTILKNKHIFINNKPITQYNYLLKQNDIITIKKDDKLDILYEDNDIIVVNKEANLLTISTLKEKEKTLYHYVSTYLKEKNKNSKVFIIHRLDQGTSGIVMFAKNMKTKEIYQNNWDQLVQKRGYYALVEGKIKSGYIESYLKENKNHIVYSSNSGKLAQTEYKVIKYIKDLTLLDINIKTGRKNQIRVHMHDLNHPIIGDKKYGSKVNPIKRLGLHAYELIIMNPYTKKVMIFKTALPEIFKEV